MKISSVAFALTLLIISMPGSAKRDGNKFLASLDKLTGNCEELAFKDGLDEHLLEQEIAYGQASEDQYEKKLEQDAKDISDCIESAKHQAAKIYKSSISNEKHKQIKRDMKAVLIAWLAYLPERVGYAQSHYEGPDNSQIQAAAYQKAVSTLKVDRLTE